MPTAHLRTLALAALVAVQPILPGASALAQAASRPDPADPKTASAMREPVSAYAGYRRFTEDLIAPWREINDEVAGIGGHAGALKDAPASPSAPSASGAPGAGGASDRAHGGMHGGHGAMSPKKQ
jgi:hypothetical protein